jgi:hypothetical protein
MADEEVMQRLREAARARGCSLGEIVREALADKAARFTPKPRSLGSGDSRGTKPYAADIGDLPIEPAAWRS